MTLIQTLMESGTNMYFWGPPGCGKSYTARVTAEKIGLEYQEVNAHEYLTFDSIVGYKSPINGEWYGTGLEKLYSNGGVLIIDEFDSLPTATQVAVNGLLDSKQFSFNEKIYKRSEKFLVVATGNTPGSGATSEFSSRNPIDRSTLNRFVSLAMDYDFETEHSMYGWWAHVAKDVREYSKRHNHKLLITFRTFAQWTKFETIEHEGVIKSTVTKGLYNETVESEIVETILEIIRRRKPKPEPVLAKKKQKPNSFEVEASVEYSEDSSEESEDIKNSKEPLEWCLEFSMKNKHLYLRFGGELRRTEFCTFVLGKMQEVRGYLPEKDVKSLVQRLSGMLYTEGFRDARESNRPMLRSK